MSTGKIKRQYMAHFIDSAAPTSSGEHTAAYERLGKQLEEFTVEMNANVETKPNILGESNTEIDSYQPSASVEPYVAVQGEGMFTRLQKIIDERLVLDDLNTSVVEVHLWEEDSTSSGSFVAYREDAVIEVVSYGGDSAGYQIPYNIHLTGNRVKGLFALATKTFTPDSATV